MPAMGQPRVPKFNMISEDEKEIIAKQFDDDLQEADGTLRSKFVKRFRRQENKILENLRLFLREHGSREIEKDDIEELLKGTGEGAKELVEDMREELTAIMQRFGEETDAKLEKARKSNPAHVIKVFSVQDPAIARYLKERTTIVVAATDELTTVFLRDGIAAQLTDDASIKGVSEFISGFFTGMTTWRADRIARTETAAAANRSIFQAFKQNEDIIDQKEWVTAGDSKVRSTHRGVAPVEIDEPFTLGSGTKTVMPSHSGVAAEDVNCRCTIVAVIKE